MPVIINNISPEEWRLIECALRTELKDEFNNKYFPNRQVKVKELLNKIEKFS